jgi:hypothetical protein
MTDAGSVLAAHLRFASREAVIDALSRLGVASGSTVPVWPPRRLPFGLFVSPVRNGWVSLWNPLDTTRDWLPGLTATLECAGVLLEAIEGRFFVAEFFRDGSLLGRMELPTATVEWDDLWARTTDSLEAEGVEPPWEDEERFGARMDEIAASEEYQEDLRQLHEERPERAALEPFLPPHASLDQAWDLLTAMDRRDTDQEAAEEEPADAEDYMETFASYLGIRDAAWDPFPDAEIFAEGDYEDEGLPEGWRDFVVLPVPQLRVL